MIIGYTTGVFDLFHIGHLKILNRAKKNCDFLIVGVTTDDLMMDYKKKTCVIPFEERSKIVANIKSVDKVVAQDSMAVTIEPGIYVPGKGGVRIEDDVLVNGNNPKVLTKAKKDLY